MDLKNFYYISKTKVEMLLPQFRHRKVSIPRISPRLEILGLSIEADIEKEKDDSLVGKTLDLVDAMEKNKLLHEMQETGVLEPGSFYRGTGNWHHGIFYFRGGVPKFWGPATDHGDRSYIDYAAYFTWRTAGSAIILLSGSPKHILGEVIAHDGIFIPGSSGVEQAVEKLVHTITLGESDTIESVSRRSVPPNLKHFYTGEYSANHATYDNRDFRAPTSVFLPPRNPVEPMPYAIFCLKYLANLPEQSIETVFKVNTRCTTSARQFWEDLIAMYQSLGTYLDEYDRERWETTLQEAERMNLKNYSTVYLGSPIYTAVE